MLVRDILLCSLFSSPFGFSFVFVFIGFVFLFFDINKTHPPGVTQGVTRRTLVDDPNRYTKWCVQFSSTYLSARPAPYSRSGAPGSACRTWLRYTRQSLDTIKTISLIFRMLLTDRSCYVWGTDPVQPVTGNYLVITGNRGSVRGDQSPHMK